MQFNTSILLREFNLVVFWYLYFITKTSFSKVHEVKMYGYNDSISLNIIQLNAAWFMHRGKTYHRMKVLNSHLRQENLYAYRLWIKFSSSSYTSVFSTNKKVKFEFLEL